MGMSLIYAQNEKKFFLEAYNGVFLKRFDFKHISLNSEYPPDIADIPEYNIVQRYTSHQANPLGVSFSIGAYYRIWYKSIIGLAYSRTVNTGYTSWTYDFYSSSPAKINIQRAKLIFVLNTYEVVYKRNIGLRNNFFWELGGYFINAVDQFVNLELYQRILAYAERTGFNSYNLLSFGFFAGIDKIIYKDNHFEWGLKSRVYYTLFDDIWEGINLNIFVRYNF